MYCASCGKSMPDGSAFCPGCGKSTVAAAAQRKATTRPDPLRILGAVVIVLGALFLFAYIFSNAKKNQLDSAGVMKAVLAVRRPVTDKIFSGNIQVGAGQYQSWTLTISKEMANAQLLGSFHASGGSGNDIQALVAPPDEFENWINGHQAKVYYSTEKATNGRIDLRLAPGTYIIAFSNRFSPITNKEVTADLELHYLKSYPP